MHKNVINCPFKGIRRVTIYSEIIPFLNYGVKMAFQIFFFGGEGWVGEREVIS